MFDFGKLAGSPSTPPHGLSVKTFLTALVETRTRSRSLSRRGSAATTALTMPTKLASALGANREAALKLWVVTKKLLRYLPVEDGEDNDKHKPAPSLMPRQRLSRVASCAACVVELEGLKVGDREGHICNLHASATSRKPGCPETS